MKSISFYRLMTVTCFVIQNDYKITYSVASGIADLGEHFQQFSFLEWQYIYMVWFICTQGYL